jgi:[ribosomal protein S18]-alanine N-acetyltransferase
MAVNTRSRRIEIVPMRAGDLEEVMAIERSSFKAPWARQVFVEELDREWAHLDVVKERDGATLRVVAFCNYWLVRDEVHILNLATHPEHRRKGHAARLLQAVIDFARRHACRYVTLEVRRSNAGAIKLYRSYGFRPIGVRPNYYVEDNEDAIVMLLDLDPAAAT